MPILAFSFSYLKQNVLQTWGLNRLITPKTLYLCGFTLDYYNATPTKNPHSQEWGFLIFYITSIIFTVLFSTLNAISKSAKSHL